VYSLCLMKAPRISFKLVKSRSKNIWQFKQGASRCKMAGARFHYIAKLRAQIRNDVLADCGVFQGDGHRENCRTADCYSQRSEFESRMPKAWTFRRVHIRPESGHWQSAAHMKADCQAFITVVANRGNRARELAISPAIFTSRDLLFETSYLFEARLYKCKTNTRSIV
jgi:hypothetical protein